MTARSRRAVADRGLERQRGVPGEEYPGVLRYLGDERIHQRPSLRLGIDGGEMRIGQHRAYQPPGLAGIDEIVDDEKTLAGAVAELRGLLRNALQHLQVTLLGVVVACDADRIDNADTEFARDDRRRHQAAARDRDHGLERPDFVEPPGQRPAIAVKLVPGDRKGLACPLLRAEFRASFNHRQSYPSVLFEHDLRANASRLLAKGQPLHALRKRGTPGPDHALRVQDVVLPCICFSISFTASIAALSLSGSRERTTRLVLGFLSSSRKG